MKAMNLLATVLVLVGGLNWGLVALAEFDLVAWIVGLTFGETNAVSRVVYGLVGLSAVYLAVQLPALRQRKNAAQVQSASSTAIPSPAMAAAIFQTGLAASACCGGPSWSSARRMVLPPVRSSESPPGACPDSPFSSSCRWGGAAGGVGSNTTHPICGK